MHLIVGAFELLTPLSLFEELRNAMELLLVCFERLDFTHWLGVIRGARWCFFALRLRYEEGCCCFGLEVRGEPLLAGSSVKERGGQPIWLL